jgi:hypothetical protein
MKNNQHGIPCRVVSSSVVKGVVKGGGVRSYSKRRICGFIKRQIGNHILLAKMAVEQYDAELEFSEFTDQRRFFSGIRVWIVNHASSNMVNVCDNVTWRYIAPVAPLETSGN